MLVVFCCWRSAMNANASLIFPAEPRQYDRRHARKGSPVFMPSPRNAANPFPAQGVRHNTLSLTEKRIRLPLLISETVFFHVFFSPVFLLGWYFLRNDTWKVERFKLFVSLDILFLVFEATPRAWLPSPMPSMSAPVTPVATPLATPLATPAATPPMPGPGQASSFLRALRVGWEKNRASFFSEQKQPFWLGEAESHLVKVANDSVAKELYGQLFPSVRVAMELWYTQTHWCIDELQSLFWDIRVSQLLSFNEYSWMNVILEVFSSGVAEKWCAGSSVGMRSAVLDEVTALQWRSRRLLQILRAWKDPWIWCGNGSKISVTITVLAINTVKTMKSPSIGQESALQWTLCWFYSQLSAFCS